MTGYDARPRYCTCGWNTVSSEPHDHDEREKANAIRAADAICWTALEAEIERYTA